MHAIILRETVCSFSTSKEMIRVANHQCKILLEDNQAAFSLQEKLAI